MTLGRNVVEYGEVLSAAMEAMEPPMEPAVARWKYIWSLYEACFRVGQVYAPTEEEVDRMTRDALAFLGKRRRGQPAELDF